MRDPENVKSDLSIQRFTYAQLEQKEIIVTSSLHKDLWVAPSSRNTTESMAYISDWFDRHAIIVLIDFDAVFSFRFVSKNFEQSKEDLYYHCNGRWYNIRDHGVI